MIGNQNKIIRIMAGRILRWLQIKSHTVVENNCGKTLEGNHVEKYF
jgi:hypothetical protein